MQIAEKTTDTYFDRNASWLIPAFVLILLTVTPGMIEALSLDGDLIPSQFHTFMLVTSVLIFGYKAFLTDTLSARIAVVVLSAIVLCRIAYFIFG